jgi:hypothetical protein
VVGDLRRKLFVILSLVAIVACLAVMLSPGQVFNGPVKPTTSSVALGVSYGGSDLVARSP